VSHEPQTVVAVDTYRALLVTGSSSLRSSRVQWWWTSALGSGPQHAALGIASELHVARIHRTEELGEGTVFGRGSCRAELNAHRSWPYFNPDIRDFAERALRGRVQ
jgi:hypothetical protein